MHRWIVEIQGDEDGAVCRIKTPARTAQDAIREIAQMEAGQIYWIGIGFAVGINIIGYKAERIPED